MQRLYSTLREIRYLFLAILVFFGLLAASRYNYILFHTLAELFTVSVAFAIFMITWNARAYLDNRFFLIIGISFLFIGSLDILHTLSYEGMDIFADYGTDLSIQLWISSRYIQAVSFLIALGFVGRNLRPIPLIIGYSSVTLFVLAAIFYWRIFPVCFVDGAGLTPFKKISEYIICIILAFSAVLLFLKRKAFDRSVFVMILMAIFTTIISELCFTLYVSVTGPASFCGHFFKIVACYFIYKALIEKAVMQPQDVIFRELKQREDALRKSETFANNVLMASLNGIYIWDLEKTTVDFINNQAEKLSGYTLEQLKAMTQADFSALFHPDEQQKMREHIKSILVSADGEILETEHRFKTGDGNWKWVFLRNSVFSRNAEGRVTQIIGTFLDITYRRQAEQEREQLLAENFEQRRLLEKLMAALPVGIAVVTGNDRRFRFANPFYRSMVSGQDPHVVGKTVEEVFSKAPAQDIADSVRKALHTNQHIGVREMELAASEKDKIRYWNMDYVPLYIQSGGPSILIIAVEVTDLVNARKQAESLTARHRAILGSLNDGVILADREGNVLEINGAALRQMKGPTSPPKHLTELNDVFEMYSLKGAQIPMTDWPLARALRGETFTNYEIRVTRKDRNISRITSFNGATIVDHKGTFISALITIRDITNQKQAEIERKRSYDEMEHRVLERTAELTNANRALKDEIAERQLAEQALRENETLLRTVLDNLPVGVRILDKRHQTIMRNPASREIWMDGQRQGALHSGEYKAWLLETGAMLQPDQWASAKALSKGKSTLNKVIEIECFDGTHKIIQQSAVPIRNAKHEIIGAVLVNQDITERKKAEEEREMYTRKLEISNRELQDFAFVASHDLQEPLRKIRAFGDLLQKNLSERIGPKGADYITRMQHAAERMQVLILDLLTYSRITTQAEPFAQVDLNTIAEEVMDDLEVRIKETGAHVEIGTLSTIEADPRQMRQLLQNLIGNALKFHAEKMPEINVGGREVTPLHKTGKKAKNQYYEIIVEDNGIGFDEKYLDRVFGPFQRLHTRMDYEGTGMGLAICRKIVERHSGTITAKSAPGKGSTFTVTMPFRQESKGK